MGDVQLFGRILIIMQFRSISVSIMKCYDTTNANVENF